MASQSLLWTALPDGRTADGGLRVSVVLVPRLDPQGDEPRLRTFPEWLDWPTTLAQATFHVTYGGVTVEVPATQTAGADRVDTSRHGAPDPAVWTALVGENLLVRAGPYRDHTAKSVVSYETTAVADTMADVYGALAEAAGDDLPTITDLLEQRGLAGLVETVRELDRRFTDERTGLRDTGRQFDAYRKSRLAEIGGPTGALARAELFHTPPSREQVVTQQRLDDPRIAATYRGHEQAQLPKPEDYAQQLDIHQILGTMSSYPTVLRRLGLVVDLVLAADHFAQSPDALLTASVTFAGGALTVSTTPQVSPVTHAALTDDAFGAVADPAPAPAAARVVDGLLELDAERFELLQLDVDAAALKLVNFARTVGRLAADDRRVSSVSRKERPVGAPALRTSGMTLVQRSRGAALEARFARNANTNGQAQSVADDDPVLPPELWAEDVVRGLRFDVWDGTTGVWRSLCRRTATYRVGDQVTVKPPDGEEEGFVRLGATSAADGHQDDLLWLHEAVVAWTGWSLTAPPPGRAVRPDDSVGTEAQTEAELPPGLQFSSRFRAVRNSLPRLRFGRSYWLRARTVDLAGNSLAPREEDFGPEEPERRAREYLRYEPVAAPAVALVRTGGTTERPAEGESMERLAIRSYNDTPADNTVPSTETARRFAVPPQVSARHAEQHGMLDRSGAVDATTFDLLANQKDRSPDDPASALVEEVIPLQGPLDDAPVDTRFAVYRDGEALTYLPDPLAEEVAVRLFGIAGVDPSDIIAIPLYADGAAWPEARPFKIELLEGPGGVAAFDPATRTLRVPLGKADRATLRMSMMMSGEALRNVMGVWRWIGAPSAALERRARSGQHWMLTPWRSVELVHAVQRPLLDPAFTQLVIDREAGATAAQPRFRAKVSIKSTDRLDLLAEWHEPDDGAPGAQVDRHRGDTAFSLKVTRPEDYDLRTPANPFGGEADHRISGEDEIDVGLEWRGAKAHELHDTRYRRIEYQLQATTKFREFLPAALAGDEERLRVAGPRRVAWIPSSSPPPAPEIVSIVPTFGWSRGVDEDGVASSLRRGGGLRVYLDRPWNASGYGEMLAVVLAPASFSGDPNTEPKSNPYKRRVTQWGNDPLFRSAFVRGIAPSRSSFPRARFAPDPSGAWLPDGTPASEADQPPGAFAVTALGPWDGPVEIAPHDVAYDAERELWYCDIEIEQGASYWPLVRLALARYQPVAVGGAELSEIVLADVMPLVADRWLTVAPPRDRRRRVTVYGLSYSESAAHQEAARSVAYSSYNPLTGKVHDHAPAHVASSTVVEVWVEALDPELGEDFGWSRVDAHVVESGDGGHEHHGHHDISIADLVRVHQIKREGRFRELAGTGIVGAITGLFELWNGTVELPRGDDRRLRLVVAEYEEHLTDDDKPYDRTPERKGRRLVFVEHFELA